MGKDISKLEEAALIRSHFKTAIEQAYEVYCESEEIAAYARLEIFRLLNLKPGSDSEENARLERIEEKTEVLTRTKENMFFILDKIRELARDRDKYISDIYMSKKIIDLQERLGNLTPWLKDLSIDVQSRAETAKLNAKISSEIGRAVKR
ncbi:MAG: hypothetical protein V2B18_16900 [Pseudomonadota bacterium]|jgi:hypothetical protein